MVPCHTKYAPIVQRLVQGTCNAQMSVRFGLGAPLSARVAIVPTDESLHMSSISGVGIMAIISDFQSEDEGSIPLHPSIWEISLMVQAVGC